MAKGLYKTIISKEFNRHLFDRVFAYSSQFAINYSNRLHPNLEFIPDYDYAADWERIYKEEQQDNAFFVETYEVTDGVQLSPVCYFIAKIEGSALVSNVYLSAQRPNTRKPLVLDPVMYDDLMDLVKELGCSTFIQKTDCNGRIWQGLKMASKFIKNYKTTFEIGHPYSTMQLDFKV